MKKTKQIAAAAGVILLAGLYVLTLIFALIDSPWALKCFKVSVGMTILIPVLLWIYLTMFRYIRQRREETAGSSGEDL